MECGRSIPSSLWAINVKDVAMNSESGTLLEGSLEAVATKDQFTVNTACAKQLLKLVLFATVNSPKAMDYIGKMTKFSQEAQGSIKSAIEEIEGHTIIDNEDAVSELPQTPEPQSDEESPCRNHTDAQRTIAIDRELLLEEQLGKAISDNGALINDKRKLQGDVQDFQNRLGRLQQHNVSHCEPQLLPRSY